MLYFVFIKKASTGQPPAPVSKVVQSYLKTLGVADTVIASPGYMSISQNTINSFINNLNFPRNTYFLEGMNGRNSCTQNNTIQQEHNSHFNNISFNHTTGNDHSKVIFFLDTKAYNNSISNKGTNIVKAVLIGSSNQSFSTYFATPKRGEADLFIIESAAVETPNATVDKDEYIRRQFLDEWIENDDNVVVSQEISRHNKHLLYDIFSDFFNI